MRKILALTLLPVCLLSEPAFAREPAQLSTTNGLLLSIFVGFGSGHFYARNKGAGAVFLTTQATALAAETAMYVGYNRKAGRLDIDDRDLRNLTLGLVAVGLATGASRIIEITTVPRAVERYNDAGGLGRITLGDVERRAAAVPTTTRSEAIEDERYQGDSAYKDGPKPPDPEEARSRNAWKLTSLIYSKLGREIDDEREDVYILVWDLLNDGCLATTIIAAIDIGASTMADPDAASVSSILRAGIPQNDSNGD